MTDHATLLRKIRDEARPYVEQWLDLTEVFSGFQKLASENGLDWGLIKGLLKAEATDERKGDGAKRVDKIIQKADAAGEYAVLLGMAPEKMNENICFVEATTGEILNDVPANGPATAPAPGAEGLSLKGDAGESMDLTVHCLKGASPANPQSPSNRDVSADGKASSAAASQGQAAHAGTGSETLASHEGQRTGEGASALSPINSTRRNADEGDAAQPEERGTRIHHAGSADGGDHDPRRLNPPTAGKDRHPISSAPVPPNEADKAPGISPDSSPVEKMSGAPFPCEANGWAGLEPPPMFDRREKAA